MVVVHLECLFFALVPVSALAHLERDTDVALIRVGLAVGLSLIRMLYPWVRNRTYHAVALHTAIHY